MPHRLAIAATLATCTALSACTNEVFTSPGGCFGGGGTGGAGGSFDEAVLLTGQPQQVELVLDVAGCGDALRDATGVTTTVVGPDNLPVAHTHGEPSSASFQHAVTVTFTPALPGQYHFTATFQPNLGVAQRDLRAALDLTHAPTELTAPSGCSQLAVTAHQAVLCRVGLDLRVTRDGAEVQTLPALAYSVSRDDVWVATSSTLGHWVDPGSGALSRAAPDDYPLPATPRGLLAESDGVWLVTDSEVTHYQPSGTALVVAARWSQPAALGNAVLAHDGNTVIVSSSSGFCTSAGGDGGTLGCNFDSRYTLGTFKAGAGLWLSPTTDHAELWLPGRTGAAASVPAPRGGWAQQLAQAAQPRLDGPYSIVFSDGAPVLAKWASTPQEVLEGWAVFDTGDHLELKRVP
ncbi:MAG: hypothetical protein IPJ65_01445 [Archangiaceae bacterium]|nr:hypothetical protein [Archangiaceae bacterium]